MYEVEYKSKLMTPEAAVRLIPARGTLSIGMAISELPALLQALEGRIKAGEIENLRVYYSHLGARGDDDDPEVRIHGRHQAASLFPDHH